MPSLILRLDRSSSIDTAIATSAAAQPSEYFFYRIHICVIQVNAAFIKKH
jgi:hypothetical protein